MIFSLYIYYDKNVVCLTSYLFYNFCFLIPTINTTNIFTVIPRIMLLYFLLAETSGINYIFHIKSDEMFFFILDLLS